MRYLTIILMIAMYVPGCNILDSHPQKYTYRLDSNFGPETQTTIEAAFQAWGDGLEMDMRRVHHGALVHVVMQPTPKGCGWWGCTTYTEINGHLEHAVIYLPAEFIGEVPNNLFVLRNMVHEIGHTFKLHHSADKTNTMWPEFAFVIYGDKLIDDNSLNKARSNVARGWVKR